MKPLKMSGASKARANQNVERPIAVDYGILHCMDPQTLCELLSELEKEDPIDFSGLPFDEQDLRRLACLNVAEMMSTWPQGQGAAREMIMAATIARLVLENMVLNARIAILNQDLS